jgi:predicted transcriptional regulator
LKFKKDLKTRKILINMGFLWFGKNKEEKLKEEITSSFDAVREDIDKISGWIGHLNTRHISHDDKFKQLFEEILKIKADVDDIKNFISFFETSSYSRVFKHQPTGVYKQTGVEGVQTRVQTAVQTPFFNTFLKNLSASERTIVWVILNSELKLSCDDVAALLGKSRATIRGQLNSIKSKSNGLVLEQIEINGKKRYYIDPSVKESLIKQLKNKSRTRKVRKEISES